MCLGGVEPFVGFQPLHFSFNMAASRSTSLRTSATSSPPARSLEESIVVNPLISRIKISKTVEVFSTVKEMEAKGDIVTSLCVG